MWTQDGITRRWGKKCSIMMQTEDWLVRIVFANLEEKKKKHFLVLIKSGNLSLAVKPAGPVGD